MFCSEGEESAAAAIWFQTPEKSVRSLLHDPSRKPWRRIGHYRIFLSIHHCNLSLELKKCSFANSLSSLYFCNSTPILSSPTFQNHLSGSPSVFSLAATSSWPVGLMGWAFHPASSFPPCFVGLLGVASRAS